MLKSILIITTILRKKGKPVKLQLRFQARIDRSPIFNVFFPPYIVNFISFHFIPFLELDLCFSFVVNFFFEENHTWVEISGIECTYYFYVFVRKVNQSIFANVCNIDMIVLIDRLSNLNITQLINQCSRPLPIAWYVKQRKIRFSWYNLSRAYFHLRYL